VVHDALLSEDIERAGALPVDATVASSVEATSALWSAKHLAAPGRLPGPPLLDDPLSMS